MGRFRLSELALTDLAEIRRYIARDKPKAAARQISLFFDKFRFLAENPLLGELQPECGADIRSFSVGTYVIFYRPATMGIEVARVVSGYRDWSGLFR